MKTRIAIVLATLVLFTVSAFAEDPQVINGPDKGVPADNANRIPKKPFIFDGVAMPAGTRLPDMPLVWVATKEDQDKGLFRVFSSLDVAKEFMKKRTPEVTTDGSREARPNWPGGCSWTNNYTRFEKSRWCGDAAWLSMYSPSGYYSQLDSIGYNNSISCVYAACDWYWTVLYSCRYFEMGYTSDCADPDRLYIEGGLIVEDLDDWGFNNRTSSTRFE